MREQTLIVLGAADVTMCRQRSMVRSTHDGAGCRLTERASATAVSPQPDVEEKESATMHFFFFYNVSMLAGDQSCGAPLLDALPAG